jgi:hypothetical protein
VLSRYLRLLKGLDDSAGKNEVSDRASRKLYCNFRVAQKI